MAARSLDLVIVGAGAAGIQAARLAQERGLRFVLLEARGRIGGRAYTHHGTGFPVDHGCHWLHSADINPLTRLADERGMVYHRTPYRGYLHTSGRWATDGELAAWTDYWRGCFATAEEAGAAGQDVSMSAVIADDPRWRSALDNWCAALNGLEPEEVSTLDCHRYLDTGLNYPLAAGYGTLISALGADLPVSLDMPVERIRWGVAGVLVDTPAGTLEAERVLLTVSTGVLAAGSIRFDPALPDWKQHAIQAVPMGQANKVIFRLREYLPDVGQNCYIRMERGIPLTLGFHCHGFGYPVVIAYLAGRSGESLEQAGSGAMVSFARERLVDIFGHRVVDLLAAEQATGWGVDPYSRGAYSLAQPGQARSREQLAEPIDEKLYFAGEATSLSGFGTAHGAWESAAIAMDQMPVAP